MKKKEKKKKKEGKKEEKKHSTFKGVDFHAILLPFSSEFNPTLLGRSIRESINHDRL